MGVPSPEVQAKLDEILDAIYGSPDPLERECFFHMTSWQLEKWLEIKKQRRAQAVDDRVEQGGWGLR